MSIFSYILGIVAALIALFVVVEMLRRRRLRERHAVWWLTACLLVLLVAIFPAILEWLSHLLGISVPTNLVFFMSIIVLFFVSLQHSSELTTLEAKVRRLAEDSALFESRIAELEALLAESKAVKTGRAGRASKAVSAKTTVRTKS